MTVSIDPNIKKTRIFLDKNGKQTTEEGMFSGAKYNVGTTTRANKSDEDEKKPT